MIRQQIVQERLPILMLYIPRSQDLRVGRIGDFIWRGVSPDGDGVRQARVGGQIGPW